MAHYAFLDKNNIVTEVIVGRDENEIVDGISDWESYYGEFRGQVCKRTSYNTISGVNQNNGTPFRYNYAGVGFTFDESKGTDGAFIPPQPYPSWTLNEETYTWNSPVPIPDIDPTDPRPYSWDEDTLSWILIS